MQKFLRLLIPILLLICVKGIAQDRHFTHFRMAPLTVNPALTGAFNGTYRISGIYRGQWTSVTSFDGGYLTPHVSIDLPILGGLLLENDWIGVGMSIVSDNAGRSNYSTRLTGISATYHLGMDDDYNRVFSVGFQYGAESRKFDTRNLITPSVLFDMGQENFNLDQDGNVRALTSGSIAIGATYKSTLNEDGDLFRAGIAVQGIKSDRSSFVRADSLARIENPLNPTIIGFGETSLMMNEKIRINPAVIFQTRSGFTTLAAQATADYLLNAKKRQILTGGLGYRFGDSVHLIGGFQMKDIKVALSYDLVMSSFSDATRNGAFEISVGYIGKIYKKPTVHPVIFCPRL